MTTPPTSSNRFTELMEALKAEYDRIAAENQSYKSIRTEWTRKLEGQASELSVMLAQFHDLERKHQHLKDQYEAEIQRLKQSPTPNNTSAATSVAVAAAAAAAAATGPGPPTPSLPPVPPSDKRRPSDPIPPSTSYAAPSALNDRPALPAMFSSAGRPPPQPANLSLPPPTAIQSISRNPASRLPAQTAMGRMPSVPLVARDPAHLAHPLKKESPSTPTHLPPPPHVTAALQSAQTQPQHPSPQPTAGQGDDWSVFQGHGANGSVVNMKVSLLNTLALESVVCCVRYSWDGQYLATGSNRCAHIFEASSGRRVATFSKDMANDRDGSNNQDSYVRAVCFSPNGRWLITGAEDHVVKVWDVRSRKVKHRLVGHGTDIYSVDASADGQFIISGSGDKKAKLWNLETGNLLSTLEGEYGPTDGITSVSVSPTSQLVAAGSLDKVVRVWEVETSRLVRKFEGHRDSVYSVAFSPDGRMLLSGSLDKTLKLWDLAASQPSSQCRLSFTGHKDFVLSVAFSPNARWLISGSKDRTVQFWDPRQSSMCFMLQGHKNSVISIAHSPTNKALATGSGDCRARTWVYS